MAKDELVTRGYSKWVGFKATSIILATILIEKNRSPFDRKQWNPTRTDKLHVNKHVYKKERQKTRVRG